jgi:hypothetical protein
VVAYAIYVVAHGGSFLVADSVQYNRVSIGGVVSGRARWPP